MWGGVCVVANKAHTWPFLKERKRRGPTLIIMKHKFWMVRRIRRQHFANHIVEQQRLVLELPDRMSEMVGRHLGQEFDAKRHHGALAFSHLLLDRCVADTDEPTSPRHPLKQLATRQVSSLCPDWTNLDVEAGQTRVRRVCKTLGLLKIQWEKHGVERVWRTLRDSVGLRCLVSEGV